MVSFLRILLISTLAIVAPASVFALTLDNFGGDDSVESQLNTSPDSSAISTNAAAGGTRTLRTVRIDGGVVGRVRLETATGFLSHSQDAQVSGQSTVTLDGDLNTSSTTYNGLGGIDLTQDNGTAVKLTGVYFDYPNNRSIDITVRIYDSSDPSGAKFASQTLTLNSFISGADLLLPFASFSLAGGATSDIFTRAGAVTLDILGLNPSVDLTLDSIGTNGECPLVPDGDGRVLDDCGVCGGNNQDKDQCGVCFGNNEALDDCGVCFGNNQDIDDCGVCFGGNSSKDQCGICGGNNSSCADCAGTPNGGAARDVCGVCQGDGKSCIDCLGMPYGSTQLDRCGVCGGNGSSCISCTDLDITQVQQQLINKAKEQAQNALFFLQRLNRNDRAFAAKSRKLIKKLYAQIEQQILALPTTVAQCEESPFCVKVSANEDFVADINTTSVEIYRNSIKILTRPVPNLDGKCRGPVSECLKRVKDRAQQKKSFTSLARRLRRDLQRILLNVPLSVSVCSS